MCSPFDGTGRWIPTPYFDLTVRQTSATWSVMAAIIALSGRGAALLLRVVLH